MEATPSEVCETYDDLAAEFPLIFNEGNVNAFVADLSIKGKIMNLPAAGLKDDRPRGPALLIQFEAMDHRLRAPIEKARKTREAKRKGGVVMEVVVAAVGEDDIVFDDKDKNRKFTASFMKMSMTEEDLGKGHRKGSLKAMIAHMDRSSDDMKNERVEFKLMLQNVMLLGLPEGFAFVVCFEVVRIDNNLLFIRCFAMPSNTMRTCARSWRRNSLTSKTSFGRQQQMVFRPQVSFMMGIEVILGIYVSVIDSRWNI
jgi:hypothetical protein